MTAYVIALKIDHRDKFDIANTFYNLIVENILNYKVIDYVKYDIKKL